MGGLFSSLSNGSNNLNTSQPQENQDIVLTDNDIKQIGMNISKPSLQNNPYITLLISHNNRIQCFIDQLIPKNKNDGCEKIRFQNGAILWISIDLNQNNLEEFPFKLSLVYSGQLIPKEENNDNPYYSCDIDKTGNNQQLGQHADTNPEKWRKFNPVNGFLSANIDNDFINNKHNDYGANILNYKYLVKLAGSLKQIGFTSLEVGCVRHGRSQHNVYIFKEQLNPFVDKSQYGGGLTKDTELTPIGKKQAQYTGYALYKILNPNYIDKIKIVFISDLMRTFYTGYYLFNMYSKYYIGFTNDSVKYIVLPCSSEIETNGKCSGMCDKKTADNALRHFKFISENFPGCNNNLDAIDSNCTGNVQNMRINWNYYLQFYDNKMRDRSSVSISKCINTNMLSQLIEITLLELNNRGIKGYSKYRDRAPAVPIQRYSNYKIGDYDETKFKSDFVVNENPNFVKGGRRSRKNKKTRGKHLSKNINKKRSNKNK